MSGSLKKYYWFALFALASLQYMLWIQEGGILSVRELNQKIKHQQLENSLARANNTTLLAEINDLKQGTQAIEERARSELGMIKQGETFYQVTHQEGD